MKSNRVKFNNFETNPCILAKYFFLNYLDFVNIFSVLTTTFFFSFEENWSSVEVIFNYLFLKLRYTG